MAFTHTDLQPYLPAPAEEIKPQLDANPVTVRDIPRPELRMWLSATGLMRVTPYPSGWMFELADAVTAIGPVIRWLADQIGNSDISHLRTASAEAVAAGLQAIQQAYHNVPDGVASPPVAVEDIDQQLLAWTGGRRFDGVTVEQIQAVLDKREKVVAIDAAMTLVDEGYHRARVAVDKGETDWQNIVDAFSTPPAPPEEG